MNKYPQFIYGKLSDANSQIYVDYEVVAQSSELHEQQNIDHLISQHKFWRNSPPKPHQAVGIFRQKNAKKLVVVQVSPPTEPTYRYFEPYRYVFIPDNDLTLSKHRTFKIIRWFLNQNIPAIRHKNMEYEKLSIPVLEQEISEYEKQKEVNLIQKCLNEKDAKGNPFLFSALALLINNKTIIINNISQKLQADIDYLYSILLLLPASCRIEIPVVVGNINEELCSTWAKILIKAVNPESVTVPKNCIWLNRNSGKFFLGCDSGQVIEIDNPEVLNSEYVDKLRQFIEKNPDKIQQLIDGLDEITDPSNTLETLTSEPFKVLNQISILDDLQSRVHKALQNGEHTKKLVDKVIINCTFQSETNEVLDKISWLNKQPDKCYFISLLLNNISKSQDILPKLPRFTQQKEGVLLSEIIDYVYQCPDTWNNYEKFAEFIHNETKVIHHKEYQARQIQILDLMLGNNTKFVINLVCKWLDLIRNRFIDEKLLQKSRTWEELLNQPDNYLDQLVEKNFNHEYLINLTNLILDDSTINLNQKNNLIKGKLLEQLIKNWNDNHQSYTEADSELITKLIKLNLDLERQSCLNLIPILLNPQLRLPKDINSKIRDCVKNSTQDDKQLLLSKAKPIISAISQPKQTRELLDKCELLGLGQYEQKQFLTRVKDEALNYSILKNYINFEELNIEKDRQIIDLLLKFQREQSEIPEFNKFYLNLFYNLVITNTISVDSKQSYTEKILNAASINKDEFIANIARKIIDSPLVVVDEILKKNSSFTYYKLLRDKVVKIVCNSPLFQDLIKSETEKIRVEYSNQLDNEIKNQFNEIKNQLDNEIKNQFNEMKNQLSNEIKNQYEQIIEEIDKRTYTENSQQEQSNKENIKDPKKKRRKSILFAKLFRIIRKLFNKFFRKLSGKR